MIEFHIFPIHEICLISGACCVLLGGITIFCLELDVLFVIVVVGVLPLSWGI